MELTRNKRKINYFCNSWNKDSRTLFSKPSRNRFGVRLFVRTVTENFVDDLEMQVEKPETPEALL